MILDSIYATLRFNWIYCLLLMHIDELKQGDKIRLLDFGLTDAAYRRRMLSLGMTRGVEFAVVRKAPWVVLCKSRCAVLF